MSIGEPPRDASKSLAPSLLQSVGLHASFYDLSAVYSLHSPTQEPATSARKSALYLHLYEQFMNLLFEIYGFVYPMIWAE